MWEDLGVFNLSSDWVFTPVVASEIFRITHLSVPINQQDYIKAVVALDFPGNTLVNIFNPQRLTARHEQETFYFARFDNSARRLAFKRVDKSKEVIWKIRIEYKNMLIPSNKPQITSAQALPDSVIVNAKKLIIPEKTDSSRRNYLISNLGPQTLYCKYLPIGGDFASSTFVISSTDYDFLLISGEKWLDSTLSQNAVYGLTANAFSAKIKAVEYNYL